MLPSNLKRFCAMLVALVMLISCMPLSALAETVENAAEQSTEAPQNEAPAAEPVAEVPAAEPAAEAPAAEPAAEVPAAEPVASVEIPVVVENIIDNAEQVMDEVAQLEETTTEELEEKLESVEDAEAAVEELEDLTDVAKDKIDDLEAAIPNIRDAVKNEDVTETEGKDALKAQHAKTEAALNAAQKQQEEAAAALELAKQEYEAAKAQSEEAQAAAMEKLLAAQEQLALAEQGTAAAKQAVDAVAEALNGIQETVEQAKENTGALVEELKAGLEESKEELKASIEDLNQATGEVKENTETLITELQNLQASAEKFEESVVTAKTTEEKALDMRAEYEEAKKALDAAQAAYDALIAEGGDVSEEQVQNLSKAIDAAKATAAEMKAATDAYETEAAKNYEKNLEILGSADATDEEKAVAEKAVAGTLIGNHTNGQTVKWVEAGASEYGKSESGYYVVLDGEDNVVGRYGYKVENGVLNVYEMKSNGTTYFIGTGNDKTEVTNEIKNGDPFTYNGNEYYKEDDKYYYNESAEHTPHSDPTEVNFKAIENQYVAGIVQGILGEDYSISELTKNDDGTYAFTLYYTAKENQGSFWKPNYIDVPKEATFSIGSNNKVSIGDQTLSKLIDYLFEVTTDNYDTIDGYRVQADENGQLYYIDANGATVNINKNDAGYYYKHAADIKEGDTSDLKFSMTDVSKGSDSAAAYSEKKAEAITNLDNANTALNQAQNDYNTAETQYHKLQAELDKIAQAEVKDLEVVTPGFSIGGIEIIPDKSVGNLADLPVTIDEILRPEDFQDPEKLAELADAIQSIGSGELSGAAALYELVGLDTADLLALTTAATVGTDFQKEYAKAWTDALTAKANVIISGFELVAQAGKTMEAGKALLTSGADATDKILEVAENAAKVAGYTGAVGVVQLGDNALELTNQVLSKLESKVTVLQLETNAAAKEVSAAKAELDAMIQKGYSPYADIMQDAKARLDLAQSKYDALIKDLEKANTDLNVAYRRIGAISAPQSVTTTTPTTGSFVLNEMRFQMLDANKNVLHFPYNVVGNTLVLNVNQAKSVIVIEVAYMAELVSQNIEVLEFRTSNGTYVLNMAAFLEAHPEVTGTVEIDLDAGTYSYVLNGNRVTEKLEVKK